MIGIDSFTLPAILGYNGTTPKTAARLDLITPSGDPLLATWQYGLGRSAAWTSDMKSQWAQLWVDWSGFAKFSAQLIGWVLPEPKSDFIEAKTTLVDNRAVINLVVLDDFGQPQNFVQASATVVGPDLDSNEIQLVQVGPGEYQGSFEVIKPGSYLIRVGANDEGLHSLGQQTLGLIVPYSPEYKNEGIDLAKLYELARITGGSELRNPQDAFVHNLTSTTFAMEIWRPLLLFTALLFPFDVAVRRLIFTKNDLKIVYSKIRELIQTKPREKAQEPKLLGPLFRARDRARSRQSMEIEGEKGTGTEPESSTGMSLPDEKPSASREGEKDEENQKVDTIARLREAKKRTQKRD